MSKRRKHHLTRRRNHSTMKLMVDQINSIIVRPSNFKFKFILLLLIALAVLIWILDYLGIINLSRHVLPPVSQLPAKSQVNKQAILDTCDVKKEGNPLVTSLSEDNDIISGTFKGKITTLAQSGSRNAVMISLTSENANQTYTFNILKQPGLFYDSNKPGSVDASALQVGQQVMITFNCLPKQGKLFKFIQVNILKS